MNATHYIPIFHITSWYTIELNGIIFAQEYLLKGTSTYFLIPIIHVYETIMLVSTIISAPFMLLSLCQQATLHKNIRVLFSFSFFVSFVNAVGRITVLLYEVELVEPSPDNSIPLLLGFCGHFFFIFSMMHLISVLPIERAVATYYITDYEYKRRIKISSTLIVTNIVESFVLSALFMDDSGAYTTIAGIILLVQVVGGFALNILVYVWNNRRLKSLNFKNDRSELVYTLGIKYQVQENMRVFRLQRKVVTYIVPPVIVIVVLLAVLPQDTAGMIYEIVVFDACIETCMVAYFAVCLHCLPEMRAVFFSYFGFLKCLKRRRTTEKRSTKTK